MWVDQRVGESERPTAPLAPRLSLRIATGVDASIAGPTGRRWGLERGLAAARAQEIAIVVSELASNQLRHAGGGVLRMRLHLGRIEIVAEDDGPGIPDVALASLDHVSDGRRLTADNRAAGLGCGLGAVQRLMDEVRIEVRPTRGTTVRAWKNVAR